jgi:hypothetical protein
MNLEQKIEAILFYKNEPLEIKTLSKMLGEKEEAVRSGITGLKIRAIATAPTAIHGYPIKNASVANTKNPTAIPVSKTVKFVYMPRAAITSNAPVMSCTERTRIMRV